MTKIEIFKSIAEDILDIDKKVIEHKTLFINNLEYKKDCSIITVRQDLKKLTDEQLTVNNIAKILNKNLDLIKL
jgi:hypothetical protein